MNIPATETYFEAIRFPKVGEISYSAVGDKGSTMAEEVNKSQMK